MICVICVRCVWLATRTSRCETCRQFLGHAHLSTTADVYLVEDEARVIRRVAEYLAEREHRAQVPPPAVAVGYDDGDLSVLFGGLPQ
jgi:integrase/recombinase XerD